MTKSLNLHLRLTKFNYTKSNISGRSMVEMLGVLAIVGVLSIGAIAGYSKAMFKYRLNKQTEQLETLLANLNIYRHEWYFSSEKNLVPYYIKLNVIPENMIKQNDTVYIYDVFNNKIRLYTSGLKTKPDGSTFTTSAGLQYYLTTDSSFDLCANIFYNIKSFKESIFRVVMAKKTEDSPSSSSYSNSYYGDKYCTVSNRKCIQNADLKDIQSLCDYCRDAKTCSFWISFPVEDAYVS